MNTEDQRHWEKLHKTYLKRLRVLELQHAEKGQNSSPELLLEIDDYREKVTDTEKKLARLKPKSKKRTNTNNQSQTITHTKKVEIEVEFKGDYEGLTPAKKEAFLRAIAAIAEISFEQVEVLMVSRGSIIFRFKVPEEAAQKLLDLYSSNDPILEEMNVAHIRKVSSEETIRGTTKDAEAEKRPRSLRLGSARVGNMIARLRTRRGFTRSKFVARIYDQLDPGDPFAETVSEALIARIETGRMVKISRRLIEIMLRALDATPTERFLVLTELNPVDEESELNDVTLTLNRIIIQLHNEAGIVVEQLLKRSNRNDLSREELFDLIEAALRATRSKKGI